MSQKKKMPKKMPAGAAEPSGQGFKPKKVQKPDITEAMKMVPKKKKKIGRTCGCSGCTLHPYECVQHRGCPGVWFENNEPVPRGFDLIAYRQEGG